MRINEEGGDKIVYAGFATDIDKKKNIYSHACFPGFHTLCDWLFIFRKK